MALLRLPDGAACLQERQLWLTGAHLQARPRPSAGARVSAYDGARRKPTLLARCSQALQASSADMAAAVSSDASRCPFHGAAAEFGTLVRSPASVQDLPVLDSTSGTPIPGPHPVNLIANILDLSHIALFGIEEATLQYSRKYGGICRFSNAVSAWTFVNDPELVHHICVTNAKNYSRRFLPAIYEYVTHGKGILGSQGEYNRQHRKMCQPPFLLKKQLQRFTQVIVDKVESISDVWEAMGSVQGDVALHIQRLTLDIIGAVAFSRDFGQIERVKEDPAGKAQGGDAGQDRLLMAVNESQQLMGNVFITPLVVLRALRALKEPGMVRMDNALNEMRSIMTNLIQDRRQEAKLTGQSVPDLLGVLLDAEDENGEKLTDEELWEDVHDIMGAGHETTATTITAALYCISQHPEVEAKVVEEVQRVLKGRPPLYEDITNGSLQYTQMVVKETLRLFPPIPLFPREVQHTDTLPGGYKIPGGDVVFMSTYAMGRNEAVWPEAELFRPERFLPEEEAMRHKFAWVPFGAGPRMCLGASFALMSVTQVVAALIQRFHFRAIKPTGVLHFKYDITMNFPGGLLMEVTPRRL
eukprot:SM000118S25598  [mRNA]  locus=s118:217470:221209:- [translate_table: standard]